MTYQKLHKNPSLEVLKNTTVESISMDTNWFFQEVLCKSFTGKENAK